MADRVTTLWIGELTRLERLCFQSFLYHGHPVHLYTYSTPNDVPDGVEVFDAAEILPKDAIFRYSPTAEKMGAFAGDKGGYGGFANLWRYHYLAKYGGWWVDADLICLKPLEFEAEYVFGSAGNKQVYNGLMKVPAGSRFTQELVRRSAAMGQGVKFCESGPALLPKVIARHGLRKYVLPTRTFYPHHWSKWKVPFQAGRPIPTSYTLHLWNEVLRRKQWDKNADYPETSQIEQIRRLVSGHVSCLGN